MRNWHHGTAGTMSQWSQPYCRLIKIKRGPNLLNALERELLRTFRANPFGQLTATVWGKLSWNAALKIYVVFA